MVSGSLCSEVLDIPPGSSSTELWSARTVRLTGVQSILVDTPDLPGTNVTLRDAGTSSDSLARVMCDCAPLSTLHYESSGGGNLLFDNAVFAFTVVLTDQYGRPLLCTVPYDATIEFRPVWTGRLHLSVPRPFALNLPYAATQQI
eukprot:TRINITY_DN3024_c0_g2_i1.p1 TRINITY_DN3024_c0_g2~~TRINITY_DN3024_c0_g2_i1.p1  ORF type:complete len:145 (-),score=23.17 TRINITY_DN3024_c0_g2_i1:17-451(-)